MAPAPAAQPAAPPRKKPELETYWKKAKLKYDTSLEEAEAEYAKKHAHFWNIHKTKLIPRPPDVNSARAFNDELARRQGELRGERRKGHAIFGTLRSLAGPVEVIGGQASGIVGMVFPATPVIFGAVMYLFDASKKVSDSFDGLDNLFKQCSEAITQVNSVVRQVRELSPELQDHVIETLVAILEVFRIASEFAAGGRLKAYLLALAGAGSSPEKDSVANMRSLAAQRVVTVVIDVLGAVDRADAKGDVRHKETVDIISSVRFEISGEFGQVKRMLEDSKEKGGASKAVPKESKDAKQKAEDRSRKILEAFLDPDKDVSSRLKEFAKTTTVGTCEWILEDLTFQTWRQDPKSPLLWIYGHSGVGKSHLAARLVREFGKSHLLGEKETEVAKVTAFFCEYDQALSIEPSALETGPKSTKLDSSPETSDEAAGPTDTQKAIEGQGNTAAAEKPVDTEPIFEFFAAGLLHTVCWQVAEDDSNYRKYLIDHLDAIRQKAGKDKPLADIWQQLFRNSYFTSQKGRSITCVIDGLDNVSQMERRGLYALFSGITVEAEKAEGCVFKFVVLSQPPLKGEIAKTKPNLAFPAITISKDKNDKDIMTFIASRIKSTPKISRALRDETFRATTIAKLANSTGGIFEMSALLLKQLAQKDHVDLFSSVLDNPPKDIQNILEQTLAHFGQTHTAQDIEDFNCLLAWVLYGSETLSLAQLNAAIGLESNHGKFLDIRDKIEREFSAYFSIVDVKGSKPLESTVRVADDNESTKYGDMETPLETQDLDEDDSTVKIAHASIAKFFRNTETSTVTEKGVAIGMRSEVAHLRLAKTCLKVICATEGQKSPLNPKGTVHALLIYAAQYFQDHLKEGRSAATLEDKIEIFGLLRKVLCEDAVIYRWVRERSIHPEWFDISRSLGTAWSWLSDQEVLEKVSEEDKAWLQEDVSIAERLLKPTAKLFAQKLLHEDSDEAASNTFYFFIFLNGFLKLFERSKETNEPTPGEHPFAYCQEMDSDAILQVAEWAGLPKDARWHTRVGMAICDVISPLTDNLLEQFRVSIALDLEFAASHWYLAKHSAELEKYDLAIDEMQKSMRIMGSVETKALAHRYSAVYVARWQAERADTLEATIEALKTLQDELDLYPKDFRLIAAYILVAGKAKRYKAIVSMLSRLSAELPEFLWFEDEEILIADVHKLIRLAAQKTRRVGLLKRSYNTALKRTGMSLNSRIVLLESLGILYAEDQEFPEAIEKYDLLIDAANESGQSYLAEDAAGQIAIFFFLGAWSLGVTEIDRKAALDKLIALEKSEEHFSDGGALNGSVYAYGLQLGLYYRLSHEDELAKPYFKDRIERAMVLLDDGDADNDLEAWNLLSDTLTKAGDYEAVPVAIGPANREWLRLMGLEDAEPEAAEEKEEEEEEEEDVDNPAPRGADEKTNASLRPDEKAPAANESIQPKSPDPMPTTQTVSHDNPTAPVPASKDDTVPSHTPSPFTVGTCNGICDRDMRQYTSSVHICVYCIDTYFCDDCYAKLKENEIAYTICDGDHEFVEAWGNPKGLKDDEVLVAGQVKDLWEWLDEIRAKWGLPLKIKVEDEKGVEMTNGAAKVEVS